jgi:hypothetical protein
MVPNADHFAAAASLQDLYGDDASIRAAMRSDAALDEGDIEGARFWQAVEKALRPRNEPCN